MTDHAHLHLTLSDDQLAAAKAESAATSLPLDGTILLRLIDLGVSQGKIDPLSMMSAQEHLQSIADKLERDGIHDSDLPDLIAKIRQLSEYASMALMAVIVESYNRQPPSHPGYLSLHQQGDRHEHHRLRIFR